MWSTTPLKTYSKRTAGGTTLKSSGNDSNTKRSPKQRRGRKRTSDLSPPRLTMHIIDSSSQSDDSGQPVTDKRPRRKLIIHELPPRLTCYSTDDSSLHVEPDNTFDKLLKGDVYNEVRIGPLCHNTTSPESSTNKSSSRMLSPITSQIKAPRKAPAPSSPLSHSSPINKKSPLSLHSSRHSPIVTRSRQKKQTTRVVNPVIIINSTDKETSTFDKEITTSLSVENVNKAADVASLSYIKLPHSSDDSACLQKSYEPLFSDTFRETQAVHSSTPCVVAAVKKIVADKLSPINKSTRFGSGLEGEESSVILVSDDDVQVISSRKSDLEAGDDDKPDLFKSSESGVFVKPLPLKPGKQYRRSLLMIRRSSVAHGTNCACEKCKLTKRSACGIQRQSQIVPLRKTSLDCSVTQNYARATLGYVSEEREEHENFDGRIRRRSLSAENKALPIVTAKEIVLRRCGQADVLSFEECYPSSAQRHCRKIGEGVYGEVFLYRNSSESTTVMKVIPIEGDLIVNGEKQKKFEEILSEIIIAQELSGLRNNATNTTTAFSEVQKVRCVQGCYPPHLLDLWDLYDETKTSENDSPRMFGPEQQFVVLELANGGVDLEAYIFSNASQAFSMFKQTACALAVAEEQLKFEHRDLHWGNILLTTVAKNKTLSFRLDGHEVQVETRGVEVTLIDFTLSRVETDGVVIFNDLGTDDELFAGEGDYQFEVYRQMKKHNRNEWQPFEPYSNILWLHYVLDKALGAALRFKNTRSMVHKQHMVRLGELKESVLLYRSALHFVTENLM